MTDRLKDLYDQQGQSPWLDNLRRGYLTSGELAALQRDQSLNGPMAHDFKDDVS